METVKYTEKQLEQRRKAVKTFTDKHDRVNCILPEGTKDRIRSLTGMSCNAFIKECILEKLDQIEKYKG